MKKLLGLIFILAVNTAYASDLFMVRSSQAFPEAMTELQNAIQEQGYKLSRVQRVDIGLTKAKYKTDKYRVVFFGKLKEVSSISSKYPEFIPYLPLKIAIFAEGNQTLLVAVNPDQFAKMYKNPKLRKYFKRWKKDIRAIMDKVAKSK